MARDIDIVLRVKDAGTPALKRVGDTAEKEGRRMRRSFGNTRRTFEKSWRRMKLFALAAIAGIVAGVGLITRSFITAGSRLEIFQVQLTTVMQGNAEAADQALASVREFAKKTPFLTRQVISSFTILKAAGIDVTEDTLRSMGDVAFTFGRAIDDIAIAVLGLETEVFRRLGITVDRTGKKAVLMAGTFRIETEKTDKAIRAGLFKLFDLQFGGAMEKAENTFRGQVALLQSAWEEFTFAAGQAIFNKLIPAMKGFAGVISQNEKQILDFARQLGVLLGIAVANTVKLTSTFVNLAFSVASFQAGLPAQVKGMRDLGEALVFLREEARKVGIFLPAGFKPVGNQLVQFQRALERIIELQQQLPRLRELITLPSGTKVPEDLNLIEQFFKIIAQRGRDAGETLRFIREQIEFFERALKVGIQRVPPPLPSIQGPFPPIGPAEEIFPSLQLKELDKFTDAIDPAFDQMRKFNRIFGEMGETSKKSFLEMLTGAKSFETFMSSVFVQTLSSIINTLTVGIADALFAALEGSQKFGEALVDVFKSIVRATIRMVVQLVIFKAIFKFVQRRSSGLATDMDQSQKASGKLAVKMGITAILMAAAARSAKRLRQELQRAAAIAIGGPIGAVLAITSFFGQGGIAGLQSGGIVRQPVMTVLGERGPEAVIPLRQDEPSLDLIANRIGDRMRAETTELHIHLEGAVIADDESIERLVERVSDVQFDLERRRKIRRPGTAA